MRAAPLLTALALGLPLGACEVWDTQLADTYLFNGPASKIIACYGQPDRRIPVGVEQIWVYRIGKLHVEGWTPALGTDERPTFSAPNGDCEARFTIDSHGVRDIQYSTTDGRTLPQAESCDIGVRKCLGLQEP